MSSQYGQFCPVAVASEIFAERHGLEQLFRDAQGARFHPLQEGPQRALAARCALGLDT